MPEFMIGDRVYGGDWCEGIIIKIEDDFADVEFDTGSGGGTACFALEELKHCEE